jgi:C-terminal processing protease CtpA/Prc
MANVMNIGGMKIGYLVYMQFISNFEDDLRSVFQTFKSQGINHLIIDLRYNPGGSVNTAQIMASMIAPQEDVGLSKVFVKYFWNNGINDYFLNKEGSDSRNLVLKFLPGEITNNLSLDQVYILTTHSTASASELIINALKPYMIVTTVGSSTVGKYTASVTFHDASKSYNWAIQPIVLKLANANDVSDYKDGFAPDYPVDDDYFAQLGSLDEDMLAKAVSLITGLPPDQLARKEIPSIIKNSQPMISASDVPVTQKQFMYIESLINQ